MYGLYYSTVVHGTVPELSYSCMAYREGTAYTGLYRIGLIGIQSLRGFRMAGVTTGTVVVQLYSWSRIIQYEPAVPVQQYR